MVNQERFAALLKLLCSVSTQDLNSILCSSDRDFLIRNSLDQVKVDSLKKKKIGLYFSASWCGPCQKFNPKLVEVYEELLSKGDFEIVFISFDHDDKAFNEYFSKMPWLSIPYSDYDTRDRLHELYNIKEIPHLVILDQNARVSSDNGVQMIYNYGIEGYPFTPERIEEIKAQEEAARREQSLRSILVTPSRDYVIAADGKKIPVAELEGKTIGLYFFYSIFKGCVALILKLVKAYNELKEKGENFEIVTIPLDDDDDEEAFTEGLKSMPWYTLPVMDKCCKKLPRHFELWMLPALVIIGPDGKTLHQNVAEAIKEHGAEAYPFTPEKFAELREIKKAKREAQTLDSILVSGDRNSVIGKDGLKISVNDLVGKNILLYFSAHCCPNSRAFLAKLLEAYHEIKAKDNAFEVIFVSGDSDEACFDEIFSRMPWLALPYEDERNETLTHLFEIRSIPTVVAIGPNGKTITTEAKNLIEKHGSEAYPFTEDRVKEIEAQKEKMAEGWPQKTNASEDKKVTKLDADDEKLQEGLVCDGDVCYKA